MEITYLQFADDTRIVCDANVEELESLKANLRLFAMISGLKLIMINVS